MSYRHMHITSFITDTGDLGRFLQATRDLRFFAHVQPLARDDGRVTAVAFWSKDLDGISDELGMEGVTTVLSGILADDIEIVSAWEPHSSALPGDRERQRVWTVPGHASVKRGAA